MSGIKQHAWKQVNAASVGAVLSLLPIAAYQLRLADELPDPPGRWFDSGRLTRSSGAYPLGVPDSLLGLASFTITRALARRAAHHPSTLWRMVLRAKLILDAGVAGANAVRQVVQYRRVCSWCMVTAGCTAWLVRSGWRLTQASTSEHRAANFSASRD